MINEESDEVLASRVLGPSTNLKLHPFFNYFEFAAQSPKTEIGVLSMVT